MKAYYMNKDLVFKKVICTVRIQLDRNFLALDLAEKNRENSTLSYRAEIFTDYSSIDFRILGRVLVDSDV